MSSCYCPACNDVTNNTRFDIYAEREKTRTEFTVQGEVLVRYRERYVERQELRCNMCSGLIYFPQAHNRKQYFAAVDADHHQRNFEIPILVITGALLFTPVLWAFRQVSGFFPSLGVVLAGFALPFVALGLAEHYLSAPVKRKVKMAFDVLKTAIITFFVSSFLLTFCSLFIPSNALKGMLVVFGTLGSVYLMSWAKFKDVKLLFEILDFEASYEESGFNQQAHASAGTAGEADTQEKVPTHEDVVAWALQFFGLSEAATEDDLKKAYRAKMVQFHPDRFEPLKESQPEKYNEALEISKKINLVNDFLNKHFKAKAAQPNAA